MTLRPPPGFIISGTHSGVGKTTASFALMAALGDAGFSVQPFILVTHARSRCYRVRDTTGNTFGEGFTYKRVLGSYVHLYFGSNRQVPRHFVDICLAARPTDRRAG